MSYPLSRDVGRGLVTRLYAGGGGVKDARNDPANNDSLRFGAEIPVRDDAAVFRLLGSLIGLAAAVRE